MEARQDHRLPVYLRVPHALRRLQPAGHAHHSPRVSQQHSPTSKSQRSPGVLAVKNLCMIELYVFLSTCLQHGEDTVVTQDKELTVSNKVWAESEAVTGVVCLSAAHMREYPRP